jgi:hypothetical protein
MPLAQIIKDSFVPVSGVVLGMLFVWIYRGLVPVLHIRLKLEWSDKPDEVVLVRVEVENTSRVAAKIKPNKITEGAPDWWGARLRLVEHDISQIERMKIQGGWVAFDEIPLEENRLPLNQIRPMPTTEYINAGEVVTLEYVYRPSGAVAVECGCQVKVKLSPVARFAHQRFWRDGNITFTTTAFAPSHGDRDRPPIHQPDS